MPAKVTTTDQILARLSGRSHGVVTRGQLIAAGVTRNEVEQRIRRGTLIKVQRGVFRVGHAARSLEAPDPRRTIALLSIRRTG